MALWSAARFSVFVLGIWGMETALCALRGGILRARFARGAPHTSPSSMTMCACRQVGTCVRRHIFPSSTDTRALFNSLVSLRKRGPSLNTGMLSNTTRDAIYPKVFRQPPISSSSTLCSTAAACSK